MSRALNIVLGLLSAGLFVSGALIAAAVLLPGLLSPAPTLDAEQGASAQPAPRTSEGADHMARSASSAETPEDKTLRLTVPGMSRVESDTVPTTTGNDEKALKKNVAVHLKSTGFPWQREANVYLAGHRIGFPGTDSFMGFYDLNKLEAGDKIYVTDSEGTRYTYRVFKKKVVRPTDVSVTRPVEGRNVLTLQTCTLPDYTQRLIVQARKVAQE